MALSFAVVAPVPLVGGMATYAASMLHHMSSYHFESEPQHM